MRLKMPSGRVRWLILTTLLVGGCGFYYWPVLESTVPGRFEGTTFDPSDPYLTVAEQQDAADILRASGIVERINGGQDWEPDLRVLRRATALTGTKGIIVEVSWETPWDSAGPWALVHCRGTRKVVHSQGWSQITRLKTWVDVEARSVVGYGVTSLPEDNPQPRMGFFNFFSLAKVYDVASGRLLLVAPPFLIPPKIILCRPGSYYRD